MILVTGLTPAWQQILQFETLLLGHVNRASEAHWCASGKVLNVAIALARLGADCTCISPVGGNVQVPVEAELTEHGVVSRLILSSQPTRTCTTLLDSSTAAVTELVENARPLNDGELAEISTLYATVAAQASVAVFTGSLPAGTPHTFYRDLLRRTSCRAIVDARGGELLAALEAGPFVVKPNREELAATVRRSLSDDDDLVAAMREMNQLGAGWVIVTDGSRAVWASSLAGVFRLRPLAVNQVINPIGCGDCLAAGLARGLSLGHELLDSLRIGIAAAAQNAAQLLPARVDGASAIALARQVNIETV